MVEGAVQAEMPAEFFKGARPIGPLASFSGADNWVAHPYKNGIALIGNPAAASDPSCGQGLSLTLRDVRATTRRAARDEDWEAAGDACACEHDRFYGVLHGWRTGSRRSFTIAAARPTRAARSDVMEDPTRLPDSLFAGPDLPINDRVRRRFFGED